ncbi:hypothetical protein BST47_16870 [Mycolicibacterium tusciae]|uniref:Uncharacterized protein n=1 Tax=Mycolicibacterium tusciae TaxID=75922 RepID=A0A1X0JMU6_9MYCO|nr:hypothetical protein BST47_16870 [Mycolicibacterium tusciae]
MCAVALPGVRHRCPCSPEGHYEGPGVADTPVGCADNPAEDKPSLLTLISVNAPCETTQTPFLETYEDVRVECAAAGEGLQHR